MNQVQGGLDRLVHLVADHLSVSHRIVQSQPKVFQKLGQPSGYVHLGVLKRARKIHLAWLIDSHCDRTCHDLQQFLYVISTLEYFALYFD